MLYEFQQRPRERDDRKASDHWGPPPLPPKPTSNRQPSTVHPSPAVETKTDNAIVVYVSKKNPDLVASLWMIGSVGGEILVVTKRSRGDKRLLQTGQHIRVRYVKFNYEESDPLYVAKVNYEVVEFAHCSKQHSLPHVIAVEPLVQIRTDILLTTKLIQLAGIDQERFRLLKCPALGNAHVALLRHTNVEKYIDDRKKFLSKDMKNKEISVEAILCFGSRDICGSSIYWFVSHFRAKEDHGKLTRFIWSEQLANGSAAPWSTDELDFMTLDDLTVLPVDENVHDDDDSLEDAAYNDALSLQNEAQTYHQRHLRECRNYAALENFVYEQRSDFERLAVDYDNADNKVKVKVATLFTLNNEIAVCFSPVYGWSVVVKSVVSPNMSAADFSRTFTLGKWITVNLLPARAESGYSKVANWIACPQYKACVPPFRMFCLNPDAEFEVIEALAFEKIARRIQNKDGLRFVLLDTTMGEVWLSGTVEYPPDSQTQTATEFVLCPTRCRCAKEVYREYEDPKLQFDVPSTTDLSLTQPRDGYESPSGETITNFISNHEDQDHRANRNGNHSPMFDLQVPEAVDPFGSGHHQKSENPNRQRSFEAGYPPRVRNYEYQQRNPGYGRPEPQGGLSYGMEPPRNQAYQKSRNPWGVGNTSMAHSQRSNQQSRSPPQQRRDTSSVSNSLADLNANHDLSLRGGEANAHMGRHATRLVNQRVSSPSLASQTRDIEYSEDETNPNASPDSYKTAESKRSVRPAQPSFEECYAHKNTASNTFARGNRFQKMRPGDDLHIGGPRPLSLQSGLSSDNADNKLSKFKQSDNERTKSLIEIPSSAHRRQPDSTTEDDWNIKTEESVPKAEERPTPKPRTIRPGSAAPAEVETSVQVSQNGQQMPFDALNSSKDDSVISDEEVYSVVGEYEANYPPELPRSASATLTELQTDSQASLILEQMSDHTDDYAETSDEEVLSVVGEARSNRPPDLPTNDILATCF